jgi:DNA-binding HxlR family transcriptional regulator
MSKLYGQPCPVACALDLLGDRWTLLLVRDLLRGRSRFHEFTETLPGIAPNILSDRLKQLEEHGIVTRRLYSEHPPRAEYLLTERGHDLQVVVGALGAWGAKHASAPNTPVHKACGHPVDVVYRCPSCAEHLTPDAVEIQRGAAHVSGPAGR